MNRTGNLIFLGIGEMTVSADPAVSLVAPHLGSCIGLTAYDPVQRIGGLVHCLLPLSKEDPAKAASQPAMYVDSGVVALLEQMLAAGAQKRNLVITAAGGSNVADEKNIFEIGKRNITVLRKILWKNNLLIAAEDLGGSGSRTVTLQIGTGVVRLKTNGAERPLLEQGAQSETMAV